jgi:hypothetical protein
MVIEKVHNQADTEYQCNVHEFISTGEGRELTRLENTHISKLNSGMNVWMGRGNRGWDSTCSHIIEPKTQ